MSDSGRTIVEEKEKIKKIILDAAAILDIGVFC
jgi:hypothetical protein